MIGLDAVISALYFIRTRVSQTAIRSARSGRSIAAAVQARSGRAEILHVPGGQHATNTRVGRAVVAAATTVFFRAYKGDFWLTACRHRWSSGSPQRKRSGPLPRPHPGPHIPAPDTAERNRRSRPKARRLPFRRVSRDTTLSPNRFPTVHRSWEDA